MLGVEQCGSSISVRYGESRHPNLETPVSHASEDLVLGASFASFVVDLHALFPLLGVLAR